MHKSLFYNSFFLLVFCCLLTVQHAESASTDYFFLKPNKFVDYLNENQGQKRALFLYASWCGACKSMFPEVIKIGDAFPGSVIPLSFDQNPKALMNFLRQYPSLPFDRVVLKNPRDRSYVKAMQRIGMRYPRAFPTTVLIDERGAVVSQGVIDLAITREFLSR